MEQFNGKVVDRLLKFKRKVLGSGSFGEVALVEWHGKPAALKVAKSSSFSKYFANEAKVLSLLKGVGGAPRLLGVTVNPPALLTTYKGSQTLDNVLENQQYDLLDVGLQVGRKLLEIHEEGIIHNDLKCNNIMVQGSPDKPKVSLIDFGIACRNNENILLNGDPDVYTKHAPEVLRRGCSTYASDIFSYGKLMLQILQSMPTKYPSLEQMFQEAAHPNPGMRPSLRILLRRLQKKQKQRTKMCFPCPNLLNVNLEQDKKMNERLKKTCRILI